MLLHAVIIELLQMNCNKRRLKIIYRFSGGRDGFILKYDCSCPNNSPMRCTNAF